MQSGNKRSKTYTKRDIVKRVAVLQNEKVQTSALWVEHVFTALRDVMMTADPELRIEIRDFGVMEVKLTKSKPQARNPKSGKIIVVPPRKKTPFKPGKLLKKFLMQPLDNNIVSRMSMPSDNPQQSHQ